MGIVGARWHVVPWRHWSITTKLRRVDHIGSRRRIRRLSTHILSQVEGHIHLIRARILHLLIRISGISASRMIPSLRHSIMIPIGHRHSIRYLRR